MEKKEIKEVKKIMGEEEKEPKEILPFLKKKIEDIERNLIHNSAGESNGIIVLKLGRMYQAILFELDKKK